MIFENVKPRLDEAIELSERGLSKQDVSFIYNELTDKKSMSTVFEYLFIKSIAFATRYDEYRFVITINPQYK